jgi:hypothetical protein
MCSVAPLMICSKSKKPAEAGERRFMQQPDIALAIRKYYEKRELNSQDIKELFFVRKTQHPPTEKAGS